MKKYAIIVAGGTGSRMQTDIPKQFLPLAGQPVIMHSISAFLNYSPEINIIIAIHPDYFDLWDKLCRQHKFLINIKYTAGGLTRYQSVKNCLNLINNDEETIVAIHDAARPFINKKFINNLFIEAQKYENAIPAIQPNDSVRVLDNETNLPIDRNKIRLIQTPQCFKLNLIKNAYSADYSDDFTDDASVLESAGFKIHLSEGSPFNFKITKSEDLILAEKIFTSFA
ncbi:MAG: 2-C-methyl-D-erythritol 4-phosphate cytidylyltransferase [Bacteroidales bacterium]|nr:2-C-methyl-D-erythritol 4-phosphate cytidylyltransferase [Bacteroidales bacterium]